MVLSPAQDDRSRQIAILNDSFRTSFVGGTIFVTEGLHQVGDEFIKLALCAARQFVAFTGDNDPHNEHDFGSMLVEGRNVLWKIDYYDPTMTQGSEDPANLAVTRRVLTVMLAEEY